MNETEGLTVWTVLTAVFLLAGAGLTLVGSIGLLRLRTFYERAHAPTLGTTLGTVFIVVASIIHFSITGGRPVVHGLLIIVLVTATTPVSLMLLVAAARFRDNLEHLARRDQKTP